MTAVPLNVDDLNIDTMTADELRALTSDVIDQLHNGAIIAAQANAISPAVGKRLAVVQAAMRAGMMAREDRLERPRTHNRRPEWPTRSGRRLCPLHVWNHWTRPLRRDWRAGSCRGALIRHLAAGLAMVSTRDTLPTACGS
jgi:hypothetical protein